MALSLFTDLVQVSLGKNSRKNTLYSVAKRFEFFKSMVTIKAVN